MLICLGAYMLQLFFCLILFCLWLSFYFCYFEHTFVLLDYNYIFELLGPIGIEDSHVTSDGHVTSWYSPYWRSSHTSDWPFQKCGSFMLICVSNCLDNCLLFCSPVCRRMTCQQGSYIILCHSILASWKMICVDMLIQWRKHYSRLFRAHVHLL